MFFKTIFKNPLKNFFQQLVPYDKINLSEKFRMGELANGPFTVKVKGNLFKICGKEISFASVLFLLSDLVYLFKTLIKYFLKCASESLLNNRW